MDNLLVAGAGWTKTLSKDNNGMCYLDNRGGLLIINTRQGSYVKILNSGQTTRIPLASNPASSPSPNAICR